MVADKLHIAYPDLHEPWNTRRGEDGGASVGSVVI